MRAGPLVYFSSASENTHRFVCKLPFARVRIPTSAAEPLPMLDEPFVLVVPSYGDGEGRGAVPKPVIRFLNAPENRALIRGAIAGGNTNFGRFYAQAGRIVADKCQVPLLDRFELMGTEADVARITAGLNRLWQTL